MAFSNLGKVLEIVEEMLNQTGLGIGAMKTYELLEKIRELKQKEEFK